MVLSFTELCHLIHSISFLELNRFVTSYSGHTEDEILESERVYDRVAVLVKLLQELLIYRPTEVN